MSSHSSFVGRQRELTLLERARAASETGQMRVVLVSGEPGIGKTRLLDACAERAMEANAVVLRGGASEAEGMPPYLPFLETLGQYISGASRDVLRQQTGAMAPVLATVFPELSLRLGDLPTQYSLPAEQARLRLYEAVGSFLAAIAATQPVVLVLDDLQWIDPASLDLLTYVARHQPLSPVLVLGAFRHGGTESNPPLSRAVVELNRLRVLETITVRPLTAEEITAVAAAYLEGRVDPSVSRLLMVQSEGNPFFAEELVRGWLETDSLLRSDSGWTLATAGVPTLPPGIAGAIRMRLERLPPETREALRTAAIIGRKFDAGLLAETLGEDLERVERHLLHAAAAGLIRMDTDVFVFSHDKIRECLYEELTAVRRGRLHGFVGAALEARDGTVGPQRLADLAFHFARSGDRERGAIYAQRAAEHAFDTSAFEEAMSLYRVALEQRDAAYPERGELSMSLGDAAILAGVEREGVTAFEYAREWFQQTGDAIRAGRAAHRLGQAWWRQEVISEARSAFEFALTLLKDHPGPELVRLLIDLGTLLAGNLGEQTSGSQHGRWALDLAEQLGDQRLIAGASRSLGNILVRSNHLDAGIALLERALSLATAADDPVEAAETCACLAPAYFWRGELRRSRNAAMQRLAFAQQSHDLYQLRHVHTWLLMLATMQGKLEEADRLIDEAQAVAERLASPEPLAWLRFCRGALAGMQGEYAAAEAWMQESLPVFRSLGPSTLTWYLGQACIVRAHGTPAQARDALDELETLLSAVPDGTMAQAEPLACLTRAALLVRDRERCERCYPKLLAFEGEYHDMTIDCLLGEIETLHDDLAAAQAHLTAAEDLARREDLVWELARTLEAQAQLALVMDRRAGASRARELLQRSREIHERLGNQSESRRLRERLRALGGRAPHLPAGLTAREAEVLRLVVSGKSNRQIAIELVLSEKTVENHLTSIYTKTGADNRAAATAFAVRNGLA